MKITYQSKHLSSGKRNPASKGQTRYHYLVSGTKDELEAFEASQGEFYSEDEDGHPFVNLPRFVGNTCEMVERRSDKRWVPATDQLQALSDLAGKYPFLANALANKAADIAAEMINPLTTSAPIAQKQPQGDAAKADLTK